MTATMTINSSTIYVDVVENNSIGKKAITRGVIDDDSIHAYRSGQCVALARAISERTGWPLMLIFTASRTRQAPEKWDNRNVAEWRTHYQSEHGTLQGWALDFIHVFVKTPKGTLIDIGGWGWPQEWKDVYSKHFGPCFLLEARPEDIDNLMSVGHYPFVTQPWQNMELAHEFVPLVLERGGYGKLVN